MGYSPCGRKESDTTERLHLHFTFSNCYIEIIRNIFKSLYNVINSSIWRLIYTNCLDTSSIYKVPKK